VEAVLAYYRKLKDTKWLIVANLSGQKQHFSSTDKVTDQIINNYTDHSNLTNLTLKPYEAFSVKVK